MLNSQDEALMNGNHASGLPQLLEAPFACLLQIHAVFLCQQKWPRVGRMTSPCTWDFRSPTASWCTVPELSDVCRVVQFPLSSCPPCLCWLAVALAEPVGVSSNRLHAEGVNGPRILLFTLHA